MTAPVPETANDEFELLAQFAKELANEAGISTDAESFANTLRWYPNKAGAVCILRKGKDRSLLATISPKSGRWSHLYPSWEPVLARLEAEKRSANVSRMSHDGMEIGEIPQ